MTMKATGLRDDLYEYILENFSGEDEFLKNLRDEAAELNIPQISISKEQVKFLQFLIKTIKAKNILEVGTLAGYSGISMARALPEDGKLITLELEPERAEFARRKFSEAGFSEKVEVVQGKALDFLSSFNPDEPIDFVFLDADKNNYYKYVNLLDKFIRVGGIVAADNAFAFGFVMDSAPERNPEDVKSIKSFNSYMVNNKNYFTTIAPVGDGLLMCLKVQN